MPLWPTRGGKPQEASVPPFIQRTNSRTVATDDCSYTNPDFYRAGPMANNGRLPSRLADPSRQQLGRVGKDLGASTKKIKSSIISCPLR